MTILWKYMRWRRATVNDKEIGRAVYFLAFVYLNLVGVALKIREGTPTSDAVRRPARTSWRATPAVFHARHRTHIRTAVAAGKNVAVALMNRSYDKIGRPILYLNW